MASCRMLAELGNCQFLIPESCKEKAAALPQKRVQLVRPGLRIARAGAEIVAVASKSKFAFFQYEPVDLDAVISHITGVDLILTEGYKHGPFPKIALFRAGSGKGLSVPAEECLAIVGDCWEPAGCPVFPLEDPQPLAEFLFRLLRTGALK